MNPLRAEMLAGVAETRPELAQAYLEALSRGSNGQPK